MEGRTRSEKGEKGRNRESRETAGRNGKGQVPIKKRKTRR